MIYQVDFEINFEDEICYKSVKQHREYVNDEKAIWTISIVEEVDCFRRSIDKLWIEEAGMCRWGLHVTGDSKRLEILGKNKHTDDLKIAKFVKDVISETWHGYPADYRQKRNDKPPENILLMWCDEGYIRKHHVSKIRSGKACNL